MWMYRWTCCGLLSETMFSVVLLCVAFLCTGVGDLLCTWRICCLLWGVSVGVFGVLDLLCRLFVGVLVSCCAVSCCCDMFSCAQGMLCCSSGRVVGGPGRGGGGGGREISCRCVGVGSGVGVCGVVTGVVCAHLGMSCVVLCTLAFPSLSLSGVVVYCSSVVCSFSFSVFFGVLSSVVVLVSCSHSLNLVVLSLVLCTLGSPLKYLSIVCCVGVFVLLHSFPVGLLSLYWLKLVLCCCCDFLLLVHRISYVLFLCLLFVFNVVFVSIPYIISTSS